MEPRPAKIRGIHAYISMLFFTNAGMVIPRVVCLNMCMWACRSSKWWNL